MFPCFELQIYIFATDNPVCFMKFFQNLVTWSLTATNLVRPPPSLPWGQLPPRPCGWTHSKCPARDTPLRTPVPSEPPKASSLSGRSSKRYSSPCPLDTETPVPQGSGAPEGTLPASHTAERCPSTRTGRWELGGEAGGWGGGRGTQHPPQSGSSAQPHDQPAERPGQMANGAGTGRRSRQRARPASRGLLVAAAFLSLTSEAPTRPGEQPKSNQNDNQRGRRKSHPTHGNALLLSPHRLTRRRPCRCAL